MSRGQTFISSMVAFAMLMFVSLLSVVASKYHERRQFDLSEDLAREKNDLSIRWESLRIERSRLGAEDQIEQIARTKLGMEAPAYDEIVFVGNDEEN